MDATTIATEQTAWELVEAWLSRHDGKMIIKEYRYPVTYGWIASEPWQDHNFDADEVHGVEVEETSISFGYGGAWCCWTAKDHPTDKFGDRYISFEDGIELVEGCVEVGYADDSYTECHLDTDELAIDDWQEFLNWCSTNTEHVATVGDSGVSSGCAWSVTYWTANIPLDNPQWAEFAQRYAESNG